jgi:hypothetical protein
MATLCPDSEVKAITVSLVPIMLVSVFLHLLIELCKENVHCKYKYNKFCSYDLYC